MAIRKERSEGDEQDREKEVSCFQVFEIGVCGLDALFFNRLHQVKIRRLIVSRQEEDRYALERINELETENLRLYTRNRFLAVALRQLMVKFKIKKLHKYLCCDHCWKEIKNEL